MTTRAVRRFDRALRSFENHVRTETERDPLDRARLDVLWIFMEDTLNPAFAYLDLSEQEEMPLYNRLRNAQERLEDAFRELDDLEDEEERDENNQLPSERDRIFYRDEDD